MQDTKQIKEHMEVLAADGKHIGTVDHMDGDKSIKLTKSDPTSGGKHHLIPMDWVDHVDAHVHLNKNANDVTAQWKAS